MNQDEIVKTRATLERALWAVADELRGQLDASEYQKYIFGVLFYRFLSERTEAKTTEILANEGDVTYQEAWADPELHDLLKAELYENLHYVIAPENLYNNLLAEINKGSNGNWSTDKLKAAFTAVEDSADKEHFEGLFDDVNLNSPGLGRDLETRNRKLGVILQKIGSIDFNLDTTEADILGDSFEYLLGKFAAGAGKKGGEFYTPQSVSKLISEILAHEKPNFTSIYDPTCGSGSLLLHIAKESTQQKNKIDLYGQELNQGTYNLARMNMIMHGVSLENFHFQNDDTLEHDRFPGKKFDVSGANPPYSAKWTHTERLEQDPRYTPYGKLAPKDKADFAFVATILDHLKDDGVAAVVLPHGVLFRGGAEGVIRKTILEKNLLHAVIGLPANLFYGTQIPTSILVFKKNRAEDEGILFIDASSLFTKGKNQNTFDKEHRTKVFEYYTARKAVADSVHVADLDEIKKNEYNLNLSRYISTEDQVEEIDLDAVQKQLQELNEQEQELQNKIKDMISQLAEVEK